MSILIALLLIVFLPRSIARSNTLIPGLRWFNERETHILSRRVILDNPQKAGGDKVRILPKDILDVLKNWRTWCVIALPLRSRSLTDPSPFTGSSSPG
jgi:hypothetical protein